MLSILTNFIQCRREAWKAWHFHGARTWKGGPEITKAKKKVEEYKRISQFGALNWQYSRARSSLAQGRSIQPIKRQIWERGRGPWKMVWRSLAEFSTPLMKTSPKFLYLVMRMLSLTGFSFRIIWSLEFLASIFNEGLMRGFWM